MSRGAGRPRDPSADEAIIGATLELIAESGFDGLRVSDVADRARVSKATMYRRWPTKHDLVLAALRTAPPLHAVDTGSLRGDLEATFAQFMRVVAESPLVSLLTALAAERLRRPQFARELDPYIQERMLPVHEAIERAVERGELPRGTDPVLLSELIGGPIVLRLFFGGATDDEAIAELISAVVEAFGVAG